jgi:hypothetical protein
MTVRRTTELLVPLAPALLLFVVLAAFVAVDPRSGSPAVPAHSATILDVRWYIGATGTRPGWAARHPTVWAAQQERLRAPWGSTSVCVWQVP